MNDIEQILERIKNSVRTTAPGAVVVLYGSYAQGDGRPDSDIDLLVLLDKDKVTRDDEIKIKYPLYNIETDTGIIISPIVIPKKIWETKHKISPFYHNVTKAGKYL
jgi:predicted nucleotidyltransferase